MSDLQKLSLDYLYSVRGKVVLITGGGTGLGYATAQGFATNGAKVYIAGRRQDVLDRAVKQFEDDSKGIPGAGSIIAIKADVSTKSSVEALVTSFEAFESKLDTLICCAGVNINQEKHVGMEDVDNIETLQEGMMSATWEGFQKTMDINISGVYFTCVGFAHLLAKAAGGKGSDDPQSSICIVSSIGGIHFGRRGLFCASYQASKAGVIHLTKVLSTRLQPLNIRVNTIAPGAFPSEMTFVTAAEMNEKLAGTMKVIPAGRAGTSEDIAGSMMYLASRAGAYVDGALLTVDGGRVLNVAGT